jgi:tartrate-resistant acid phosphatase type 5
MKKIIFFLCIIIFTLAFFAITSATKYKKSMPINTQLAKKDSYKFFVIGDVGTGSSKQEKVAQAMDKVCQQEADYDGILLLGDNIYDKGVYSATDPLWEKIIDTPYHKKTCIGKLKIYPVLGNHDYKGSVQAQIDRSLVDSLWHMPHRFYSLKFGSLLKIIALDSMRPDLCLVPELCSLDFLYSQINKGQTPWTIVMSHYPLSSASSGSKANYRGEDLSSAILRYISCNKADLWLAGHAHHLEHRKTASCNADMIISGTAGGNSDKYYEGQKESKFISKESGFVSIKVDDKELNMRFFNSEAILLYKGSRIKDSL